MKKTKKIDRHCIFSNDEFTFAITKKTKMKKKEEIMENEKLRIVITKHPSSKIVLPKKKNKKTNI